jgi:pSer/pThr/pTyr-binding forkhead associated (FHA) protein
MLRLQFRSAPDKFIILSSPVSIGSDEGNGLVIDSGSISDFHAEIRMEARQSIIVDLISASGTYVNEERISEPTRLSSWDIIRLGDVELEVCDPGSCRPGDWALRTDSDLLASQFYPLQGVMVLGRGSECDLRIESQLLSRQHARLAIEGDVLRVVDLDSTNGTFLNGKRISEAIASPGDELSFDRHSFIIEGPQIDPREAAGAANEKTLLRGKGGL